MKPIVPRVTLMWLRVLQFYANQTSISPNLGKDQTITGSEKCTLCFSIYLAIQILRTLLLWISHRWK
uniref:Uncharacterized protein n=1 Tax=Solanum lycopersicum TaxID=4081 RepID=A0A3Q7G7F1_SOLLC